MSIALLAGCAGPLSPALDVPSSTPGTLVPRSHSASAGKLQHVLILVQENRSFDDFFATFPGADGATSGLDHSGGTLPLKKSDLADSQDLCHSHSCYLTDYDQTKMDGWDISAYFVGDSGLEPYQYVDPKQIQPYWTMAKRWVLADHLFQTQGSSSFTAHQDLIAGDTAVDQNYHVIDVPSAGPWGCDAPGGTFTALIDKRGAYTPYKSSGPFPCFTYRTLRDLLDNAGVSWKYYVQALDDRDGSGKIWDAFEAIKAVRFGPEWRTNISSPNTNLFKDIKNGTLPAVSWVIPDGIDSDHPGHSSDTGPSWVAQVVNAVGRSQYWKSSAVIVVWDDWGGLYDHVPPPQLGFGGLGFRVPALFISPYARQGYVSHAQYEFGSILKFVEDNWNLGRIGTTDVRANSIGDSFNFTQPPHPFKPLAAKYPLEYFLHRPPSNVPVDDE